MTIPPHEIECPGHGPMRRIVLQGVLVEVRCQTCGNQPIDLLERLYISEEE